MSATPSLQRLGLPCGGKGLPRNRYLQNSWGLLRTKHLYRLFHLLKAYSRVHTRSGRSFVRDSEDREGKGVRNTTAEVPLTSNGDNRLRSNVLHNLPCQVSTCGYKEFELVGISDIDEISYFAFPTTLAIIDIVSDPNIAFIDLETVGKKEKNARHLILSLPHHQPVVEVNDVTLQLLFPFF